MGIQVQEQPESDMHAAIINVFMILPEIIHSTNYYNAIHLNHTETDANLYSNNHYKSDMNI
ncbi:hypothetical protein A6U95_28210 [Serratia sp. 14-2641]|nr:hypothetical protein A6U95_28210 [Serratia sp. 14-2641]